MKLSNEEKIEAILIASKQIIIKQVSQAEMDWIDYKKAGNVKRAQVISQIYQEFPDLKKFISQEEIISKLDILIDDVLKNARAIINSNEQIALKASKPKELEEIRTSAPKKPRRHRSRSRSKKDKTFEGENTNESKDTHKHINDITNNTESKEPSFNNKKLSDRERLVNKLDEVMKNDG
jgi:hypothetical protein